jgi:RNA 2',3'-cyclic 3'-phosphodiesterase
VSDHLFLAIPLPLQIKENLDDFSCNWIGKLPFKKWTYKDDFHITLSFLGPVTNTKSKELMEQLHKDLCDMKRFKLSTNKLGIFGNTDQPRVWWCGVNNSKELVDLHKQISIVCEKQGFSVEKRPYRPHITIAKKFNDQFSNDFNIPLTWFGNEMEFEVNEVVLYKIHPSKKPSYEAIEVVNLN